jgi:Zn ribbon nucleic-acid-binding protein
MKIKESKVIEELQLVPFGGKGWMGGDNLVCPECNKSGKFGIKFSDNGGAVHCFICDYSESIYKYLKRIGKDIYLNMKNQLD